jgi:cytochrome c556
MKVKMTLATTLALACVAGCFGISTTSAQSAVARENGATTQNDNEPAGNNQVESDDVTDPSKAKDFWMEQKLRLSKEILTGLVKSDFKEIGKNAEIMRGLNRVEAFVRRRTEGYRDQLKQFDMANKALIRASQEENVDAASLAFNQLTVSCVNCHKDLRAEE